MGCDIHIVLESRKSRTETEAAGQWIGVWCSDAFPDRPKIAQRDYDFFAALASVRSGQVGDHIRTRRYPRNLPEDLSPLAWREYMRAPTDHHSPSWMDASEFVSVWAEVRQGDGERAPTIWSALGAHHEDQNYRVVFWFDN